MAVPRFYNTRHHLRNREPQIPWTADGIFGSPKNLDRAANRVFPRHCGGIQVVVHVENRIVDVVGNRREGVLRRFDECEFGAESLDYTPPIESRFGDTKLRKKYPLEFVSSKNDDSMNSTFGNRDRVDEQTSVLHIASVDAEPRGIRSGDLVRAFNDRGSLILKADVDGVVGPGVVRAPAVRWAKRALDGRSANALTSERLTDIGGGPSFYSCLIEVEKCGD
jgi:anaerobic selenocysteine-containing dehydrogenase